jgi:hypothetical protein
MDKLKNICVMLLPIILVISIAYFAIPDPRINMTSGRFIKALITNTNPETYCIGEVLYRIKTREIAPAEVISIETSVIDSSRNFARVYIVAEMKLEGEADVGFYEAELIKEDGWKVYALRETMPRVNSFSLPGKPDVEGIYEKCFSQMAQGDVSLLAGPARTAYKSQPALSTKPEITDLQTEILYNNKLVIAKHSYTYDQREVRVVAHYYKTSEGYKIVAIQSI